MLTARELADLRADMVELMPGTAVIERPTETVDNAGIPKQSWAAVGTVICRVDPAYRMDSRGVVADREAARVYFTMTVPWDANIAEGDRVVVSGDTLEIVQLYDIHEMRVSKRAQLARIEGA